MRHARDISSAAGDTSDARNAVRHLRSIHEGDGDAVKTSSEWKNQWWRHHLHSSALALRQF